MNHCVTKQDDSLKTSLKDWTEGTGNNRYKDKKNLLLYWLMIWNWTTEEVIRRLFGINGRPCAALCRRGLIRKITHSHKLGAHRSVYVIGEAFISEAENIYSNNWPNYRHRPYRQHLTDIPLSKYGIHNEIAQLEAIEAIYKDHAESDISDLMRTSPLTTEWEWRSQYSALAIPDFVIHYLSPGTDDDYDIWYEIELTHKNINALQDMLWAREKARRQGKFKKIVWICSSDRLAQKIRSVLEKEQVRREFDRTDLDLLDSRDANGWDPKALLEITSFHEVGSSYKARIGNC